MASSSSSRTMMVNVTTMMMMMMMVGMASAVTLLEKCGNDFQKVAVCLSFATGKAAAPTKNCCDSVSGIKENEPECLCFIMQQTHSGNANIKQMGLQEGKLLQLPSACALKNASLSECPKLLGLAPDSPDAAIFSSNATTTPASLTPPATTGTGSSSSQSGNSGTILIAGPVSVAVAALVAIALCVPFKTSSF